MGGKSETTQNVSQTSKTTPYGPAAGPINSLVGQLGNVDPSLTGVETGALDALSANAAAGNPYAPAIGNVATNLLGGGTDRTGLVNDAYSQYLKTVSPTANGAFLDPSSNPELMKFIGIAGDDAASRVNSMFASAGRDFSGAHARALGRGVSAATAPILYDAYNQAKTGQMDAAGNLFQAGGATAGLLSGLDQTALGNQQAGIGAASSAMQAQDSPFMQQLAIEAQRRGIPMNNIQSLLGALGPIAEAFGTKTGTSNSTGTQTMSGAQQFATIAQGLGSLFGGGQKPATGAQPFSMWG